MVDLAFRFVFANKNISTALSGMRDLKMLKDNITTAAGPEGLSQKEKKLVQEIY